MNYLKNSEVTAARSNYIINIDQQTLVIPWQFQRDIKFSTHKTQFIIQELSLVNQVRGASFRSYNPLSKTNT